MLLTLQRTIRGDRYTMDTLAIIGEPFCATQETTDRHLTVETITPESKVNGRTAIPTGALSCEFDLFSSIQLPATLGAVSTLLRGHPQSVAAPRPMESVAGQNIGNCGAS